MTKKIFEKIYQLVKLIPKGEVTTYGQIAKKLKISSRTVGWALHANHNSDIPCHRVVTKNGRIAKNYSMGRWRKQRERLISEGVRFKDKIHVLFKI